MADKSERLDYVANVNHKAAPYKSTIAQFFAGTVACIVLMSIGMMLVIPTVAIGSLHNKNSSEIPQLNDDEASWFGSLMYLLQPFSSVFGAFLQPYIGRKYGLMLTQAAQIISWICLSLTESVEVLYLSVIIFGISAGLMEAPTYAYLGEISEPRLRSLLTCMTSIAVFIGIFFEYFLASIFNWRQTAAISTAFPVIGIFLITFIPESPIWLLKREKEIFALKSLCWLRGWVREDSVKAEFEDMKNYIKYSATSNKANERSSRTNFFEKGWKKITRPKLWRPLLLVIACHLCYHSTGLTAMKSYLVEVLNAFPVTVEPKRFLFIISLLMIFGGIVCFLTVKFLGKRALLLSSAYITSLICVLLGAYIFWNDQINMPWIPSMLMWVLHFLLTVGLGPIPWMLSSEIFSANDRALGAGLAAASCAIIAFPFSKTFYNLKEVIHLSGCFVVYGILGFIISTYLYLYLPETEGKSLAEIEQFFCKQLRKQSPREVTRI